MNDEQMRKWIRLCYEEATKSPDPSTQIGSVIVSRLQTPWPGTLTHNGFTCGWDPQPEDLERPRKYQLIEHAERRAIYHAADRGFPTRYCTLVSTWAACADCARAIVSSGITRLVRHYPPLDSATERWLESVSLGDQIMKSGGVDIIDIIGPIPGAPTVLRGGELFDPTQ